MRSRTTIGSEQHNIGGGFWLNTIFEYITTCPILGLYALFLRAMTSVRIVACAQTVVRSLVRPHARTHARSHARTHAHTHMFAPQRPHVQIEIDSQKIYISSSWVGDGFASNTTRQQRQRRRTHASNVVVRFDIIHSVYSLGRTCAGSQRMTIGKLHYRLLLLLLMLLLSTLCWRWPHAGWIVDGVIVDVQVPRGPREPAQCLYHIHIICSNIDSMRTRTRFARMRWSIFLDATASPLPSRFANTSWKFLRPLRRACCMNVAACAASTQTSDGRSERAHNFDRNKLVAHKHHIHTGTPTHAHDHRTHVVHSVRAVKRRTAARHQQHNNKHFSVPIVCPLNKKTLKLSCGLRSSDVPYSINMSCFGQVLTGRIQRTRIAYCSHIK